MDRAASEENEPQGADGLPAHGATVAFIVEQLRDDILSGRLAPGSRLVECDLTGRFGVSRGPVRESLRLLAAEGLVEHWPNRGALVRRLSARTMRELFQIRIEMEALAARLAAQSDDADARALFAEEIRPIFDEREREASSYLTENAAFHDAVTALAGNRQLRELATRLRLPLIMAQAGDVLTAEALKTSVREHRAIAEAVLERDPEAAAARMRAHLERAAALALAREDVSAAGTTPIDELRFTAARPTTARADKIAS